MFNRKKMLAALRWLHRNPNKHISGDLAETADGFSCSTLDPDADCFCVLGRYANECGINTSQMSLEDFQLSSADEPLYDRLWMKNDFVVKIEANPAILLGELFNFTPEEITEG